jgi:hypothetical protein
MTMDGITRGLPRKINNPIVDGVVKGCRADLHPKLMPHTPKVTASATTYSTGIFGAMPTPMGQGDAANGAGPKAAGGMKMATGIARRSKKMMYE